MELAYTDHASSRAISRNIPADVVDCVYAYGRAVTKRGATSYQLDQQGIELLGDELGPAAAQRYRRYSDVFVIVGRNERIVTVARQNQRFRR